MMRIHLKHATLTDPLVLNNVAADTPMDTFTAMCRTKAGIDDDVDILKDGGCQSKVTEVADLCHEDVVVLRSKRKREGSAAEAQIPDATSVHDVCMPIETKKIPYAWQTNRRHELFVLAYDKLGREATQTTVQKYMQNYIQGSDSWDSSDVPTTEQVKSHLQKYRMLLTNRDQGDVPPRQSTTTITITAKQNGHTGRLSLACSAGCVLNSCATAQVYKARTRHMKCKHPGCILVTKYGQTKGVEVMEVAAETEEEEEVMGVA